MTQGETISTYVDAVQYKAIKDNIPTKWLSTYNFLQKATRELLVKEKLIK